MKNLQISKLLSVALLVSVASQAAAVPGWDTAKRWGGNVAGVFKPCEVIRHDYSVDEDGKPMKFKLDKDNDPVSADKAGTCFAFPMEFDEENGAYFVGNDVKSASEKKAEKQAEYNAWAKSDKDAGRFKKAYDKPFQMLESSYVFKLNHPYVATTGKYAVIAAVASSLGYGAYTLYNEFFAKAENFNALEEAAQKVLNAAQRIPSESKIAEPKAAKYATQALASRKFKAVLAKLTEGDRTALQEAAQSFEQAVEDVLNGKAKVAKLAQTSSTLTVCIDKCNKALEEKTEEVSEEAK